MSLKLASEVYSDEVCKLVLSGAVQIASEVAINVQFIMHRLRN